MIPSYGKNRGDPVARQCAPEPLHYNPYQSIDAVAWLEDKAKRIQLKRAYYVYCLWHGDEIVYVGSTKCLERRLEGHRSNKKRTFEYDSFTRYPFNSKGEAVTFERAMILRVDSPNNSQKHKNTYGGIAAGRLLGISL